MKDDPLNKFLGIAAVLLIGYFWYSGEQSNTQRQIEQLQIQNQLLQTELQGFRDGVIYSQP
jgi:hypothetical protein